jgi:hypothetical protein
MDNPTLVTTLQGAVLVGRSEHLESIVDGLNRPCLFWPECLETVPRFLVQVGVVVMCY